MNVVESLILNDFEPLWLKERRRARLWLTFLLLSHASGKDKFRREVRNTPFKMKFESQLELISLLRTERVGLSKLRDRRKHHFQVFGAARVEGDRPRLTVTENEIHLLLGARVDDR